MKPVAMFFQTLGSLSLTLPKFVEYKEMSLKRDDTACALELTREQAHVIALGVTVLSEEDRIQSQEEHEKHVAVVPRFSLTSGSLQV